MVGSDIDFLYYSWTYFEGGDASQFHDAVAGWAAKLPKQVRYVIVVVCESTLLKVFWTALLASIPEEISLQIFPGFLRALGMDIELHFHFSFRPELAKTKYQKALVFWMYESALRFQC
jgi:hypothetical protein